MIRQRDVKTSDAARWSLRLACLSWPSILITSVGHRFELITFEQTITLISATWLLALGAVGLGIFAAVAIWEYGYHGGWRALFGILCGSITLLPALTGFAAALYYPVLNDISTDRVNPPVYTVAKFVRSPYDHPLDELSEDELAQQEVSYPDLQGRVFRLATTTVFESVERVVKSQWFWTVLDIRAPDDETGQGILEVVAITPLFAFRDDIVIRVLPDEAGSRLDIRSASRRGRHDFGANARRIEYLLNTIEADLAVNR